MRSSLFCLLLGTGSVMALRLPANVKALSTGAPKAHRREIAPAPPLPSDFNPSNGIFPASGPTNPSSPTPTNPLTPTSPSPAPTATPTCYQQQEDPDRGINQQGCICNVGTTTKTLPIFSSGGTNSCAWPNLDQSTTLQITTSFGPVSTDSWGCSVCTQTAIDGQTCTSMAGCLPDTATVSIQVGTSPIPVGTLTSSALFASLSSAISVLCLPTSTPNPPPTSVVCADGPKVTIDSVPFLDGDLLAQNGQIVIWTPSSGASNYSQMEALVGMAAQSFVSSATGNNCQVGTVQSPSGQSRRWEGPFLEDRASGPGTSGDPGAETQQNVTVCNMGNFVGPQYYAQGWRQAAGPGPAAFVDVEASYQVSSTLDTELLCDFFEAALLIIEADYTPELMRLDYKIDKKAEMACTKAFDYIS